MSTQRIQTRNQKTKNTKMPHCHADHSRASDPFFDETVCKALSVQASGMEPNKVDALMTETCQCMEAKKFYMSDINSKEFDRAGAECYQQHLLPKLPENYRIGLNKKQLQALPPAALGAIFEVQQTTTNNPNPNEPLSETFPDNVELNDIFNLKIGIPVIGHIDGF